MLLRELIKPLRATRVEGSLDREVTGIACDSRRVFPGRVFVAVPGLKTDGHQFISSAIDRGACAVICQENGFSSQRATRIEVPDSREALAMVAAVFYEQPSRKLRVVGITGTNGKTTVAFLVRHLLETVGLRCGLITTVCYEIGDRVIPAQRSTPEAVELQEMMAQMVRSDCRACVIEVSSHGLDQRRVDQVAFDVGVFTNLSHDHLDYHGSVEKYFEVKRKLFQYLEGDSKSLGAVINIDDPYGVRLNAATSIQVVLSYGTSARAKLRAEDLRLHADHTEMRVVAPSGQFVCRLPLIGRYNVSNALAAVGTGLLLGIPLEAVGAALASAPQVPGRLERVIGNQPFSVFVDYAHTADALEHVLSGLREITSGALRLVFGCGGDRDASKRNPMGEVSGRLADEVVVTSDNPRRESPAEIAAQIESGLRRAGRGTWRVELDRRRAIEETLRGASAGDTVLIAGKGHETFQEFEDTVTPFDDRLLAMETLETLGFSVEPRSGS